MPSSAEIKKMLADLTALCHPESGAAAEEIAYATCEYVEAANQHDAAMEDLARQEALSHQEDIAHTNATAIIRLGF